MKLITGSSGQINEFLKGIPNNEYLGMNVVNGKTSILLKSDVTPIVAGEVVEKIVEVDNPVHLKKIEELEEQNETYDAELAKVCKDNEEQAENIQTLQDALADALNAEEAAKKEAEDLKKQIPKLKASVAKLKKVLAED